MKKLLFGLITIMSSLMINAEEYSLVITGDYFPDYGYDSSSVTIYANNNKPYVIDYKSVTCSRWHNSCPVIKFHDTNCPENIQSNITGLIPNITKIVIDYTNVCPEAGRRQMWHRSPVLNVCIGEDTISGISNDSIINDHYHTLFIYYPKHFSNNFHIFYNYIVDDVITHYDVKCSSITIYFKNGDAVSVNNTPTPKKGKTLIKDGKIVLQYNDKYYNLIGQQL